MSADDKGSGLNVKKSVVAGDGGSVTHLRIEGCLDAITAADIRPVIEAVVGEPSALRVVVDLESLRLIDSSGVGALVSLYKRMREKGGTVAVEGLKDQPLAIFKLLRLDRVFTG
jgi:anti-sigma B factor antagonist